MNVRNENCEQSMTNVCVCVCLYDVTLCSETEMNDCRSSRNAKKCKVI